MTRWLRAFGLVVLLVVPALAACGSGADIDPVAAGSTAPDDTGSGGSGVRAAPPAGDPSVTGTIASVSPVGQTAECDQPRDTIDPDDAVSSDDEVACAPKSGPSVFGTFVVQDGVDASGADLAASVSVPKDIAILREEGPGWALASFEDLQVGTGVQVWFDGPVAESYPVQAKAGSIVITQN